MVFSPYYVYFLPCTGFALLCRDEFKVVFSFYFSE